MTLSSAGLELIQHFEGYRSHTYNDIAGIPTIGYGHRILNGEIFPDGVIEAEALTMLKKDIRMAEQAIAYHVRVLLTQGQYDALVDFVYNLGVGKLLSSTLLKKLNSGNYDEAGQQLLRWDHCGSREISGLKIRREAEFRFWNQGASDSKGGL